MGRSKQVFNNLLELLPVKGSNDQMNEVPNLRKPLNLRNPYGPIVCFIVYLYSMEFGNPPLYSDLNRAARQRDSSFLGNLGGYARALSKISELSENFREEFDKI